MENKGWSVVFEGKIASGRRVEEVKKNLAIVFRTSTGKIERLFSGPRTVIKRNLSHPAAMKYKKVLAHVGALCSLENAEKVQKSKFRKEIDSNPVPAGGAKGSMVCPMCSHEQDTAEECIRCGHCHEICPEEAVRHDGERIPQDVEANLQWVRGLLKHYETPEQKQGLLERMKRHFAKERKIAEQTIEKLESLA